MLLDQAKKRTDKILRPLAVGIYKLGLTPNMITFISFLFTVGAVILFAKGRPFYAGLALLGDYFLDLIDGQVARINHHQTELGYFSDRFSRDFGCGRLPQKGFPSE